MDFSSPRVADLVLPWPVQFRGTLMLFPLVFLLGCAATPPLLNSERIQQTFGSYGVDVIEQNSHSRIACLYSLENGRRICRTYAETRFVSPDHPALSAVHAQVLAGGSIGESFRSHGWTIGKHRMQIGSYRLPQEATRLRQLMRLQGPACVAYHRYRFSVEKHGEKVEYAEITEIHHPAYLDIADLERLFPDAERPGPGVSPGERDPGRKGDRAAAVAPPVPPRYAVHARG